MNRDDVIKFFEGRQLDWRARNADALAMHHHENGTVVSPMFGALHGRTEIADAYRRLFTTFPDWFFKNEELIIDGSRVAQHFVATATHVGEFMVRGAAVRRGHRTVSFEAAAPATCPSYCPSKRRATLS